MFEISLSRGYDTTAFRQDLKALYTKLGQENKQVCLCVGEGGCWPSKGAAGATAEAC